MKFLGLFNRIKNTKYGPYIGLAVLLAFFIGWPSTSQANLNEQLSIIKGQIQELTDSIAAKNEEAFSLQNEVDRTTAEVERTELEIQRTQTEITQLEGFIVFTDKAIERNRQRLFQKKKALAELVRSLYDEDRKSSLEIFLNQYELADFVRAATGLGTVEGKVYNTVVTIKKIKKELEMQQTKNKARRQELDVMASTLEVQRQELAVKQEEQQFLLDEKLREKTEDEARLAIVKYIESQILQGVYDLNSLNRSLPLTEAFRLAKWVGEKTGVRPALVLGLIQQESNFNPRAGSGRYPDDVHPDHRDALVRVAEKLGQDPTSVPVSKKPTNYRGWGGAMGAAQIMPRKWESIEGAIAALSGKPLPSPWSVDDAFLAAGFILQGLGAHPYDTAAETQACGRYFAGGNWEKYPWYAEQVLRKAAIYEERLNVLP